MLNMIARSMTFGVTIFLVTLSNSSWAEKDSREVIVLDDAARAFVIREMRQNLSGLQQALTALSKDDMEGVSAALRPLGMQGMGSAPPSLMSSVPDGFKAIGMPMHMAFDAIADAAVMEDSKKDILASLGKAMQNCVACHAAYRVESK